MLISLIKLLKIIYQNQNNMERITHLDNFKLQEILDEFCGITGLKNENPTPMANFLRRKKGGIYVTTLVNALNNWAAGDYPHIKRPYSLTVDFISYVISAYMSAAQEENRTRGNFQPIDPDKITDEQFRKENPTKAREISKTHFEIISEQYYETFFRNNPKLISLYALSLCYEYLVEEGLDPHQYDEETIHRKQTRLESWDTSTKLSGGIKNLLPAPPKTNTIKAAIAALYMEEMYKG